VDCVSNPQFSFYFVRLFLSFFRRKKKWFSTVFFFFLEKEKKRRNIFILILYLLSVSRGVYDMPKPMYVRFEMPRELVEKVYELVEIVRESGKLKRGTNEVTKIVERGDAKLVIMSEDVSPEEILAHMPVLCDEKSVPYAYVPSKLKLGNAAGLEKSAASVAVVDAGKGKSLFDEIISSINELKK
jgi:large subunit ribosomal protein L7Ae